MLDFANFANQFPDPNKEEVLRVLEAVKFALIKHLSLQTINNPRAHARGIPASDAGVSQTT